MRSRRYNSLVLLGLPTRQVEIAVLLCEGLSEEEIAKRLYRSPHTIHDHVKRIYQRLNVHSHHELLRLVHEKMHKTT